MQMTSKNIKSFQELDTILYADSVEWCPSNNFQHYMVCGTYQLQEDSSNSRLGAIQLYALESNPSPQLVLQSTISGPGVLDIKWSQGTEVPIGGMVNAEGYLEIFQLQNKELKVFERLSIENNGLVLSLDYCKSEVLASTSNGRLVLTEVDNSGLVEKLSWKAHDYEAWTCARSRIQDNVVYSGGDDCKLKVWDIRINPAVTVTSKKFDMGVTNIAVDPHSGNLVCVGSYDEYLRLWDSRKFDKSLQEINLGGGIWRTKFNPFDANYVAVAAMHNNVHIVELKNFAKTAAFMEHKSMVYGIDWCFYSNVAGPNSNSFLLSSCSFYDHSVQLWSWENENK